MRVDMKRVGFLDRHANAIGLFALGILNVAVGFYLGGRAGVFAGTIGGFCMGTAVWQDLCSEFRDIALESNEGWKKSQDQTRDLLVLLQKVTGRWN